MWGVDDDPPCDSGVEVGEIGFGVAPALLGIHQMFMHLAPPPPLPQAQPLPHHLEAPLK